VRDKTANVALVVTDGLALFEFAVASDVFGIDRTGEYGVPWYEMTICSPGGRAVTTDTHLRVQGTTGMRAMDDADMVIVSPSAPERPVPEMLIQGLRRAHRRGARIVSLCTGAFVLAAAGLLDGRHATTHWEECEQLATLYPRVHVDPDVLYVDDGDVLTAAGSAAAIDLCLHIVRRDHGAEIAARLARELVVPPFREGGQAQYIDSPLLALDPADPFLDVLNWAQENLHEPITIADLARRAAMSNRNFSRRFLAALGTTPYRWVLRQRLQLAQRLLETTDLSVEAVAEASGFATAANLRARFVDGLHTTPTAYRRTFRGGAELTRAAMPITATPQPQPSSPSVAARACLR
jgi:AraC family transcriptional regulator, transcriptional activator FtrA